MSVDVEFASKSTADRFRRDHPEHVSDRDDARLKTVRFAVDAPEWLIERAEAAGFEERAEREAVPGEHAELSESERESLARQHRNWSWQQHGFEAMRAKGALQSQGVTEWMDFYEPGEGAAGALKNLRASKERGAITGAPIGIGSEHRERDPDDPAVMRHRATQVAEVSVEECSHAEGFCRRGDPEACEFLGEVCGFNEDGEPAGVGRWRT